MKIAIIGTGKIIPTAIEALQQVPQIEITAIFGRPHSREKAEQIAKTYHIPKVFTDYAQLLEETDVEFVYIGLVNSAHYPYSKEALLAGKHVIVEKPFCSNYREANELAEIAIGKGLYLFEAVTLLHLPNMQAIREALPQLGHIRIVNCNYSQYSSRYNRFLEGDVAPALDPRLSGGTLMDINIYNLNFVLGLFGMPQSVNYNAHIGFNGIDTSGILTLGYPDFTAVCIGAKDSDSPGYCTIQGEKGWLQVKGTPNEFKGFTLCIDKEKTDHQLNLYENRMVHEFIEFNEIYEQNDYQRMISFLHISLNEIRVTDMARKDAGITFPAD